MSYLAYNGTKLIPAPFISVKPGVLRTEDGSFIGKTLDITLSGKIVANRGGLYTGSGYPADDFTKCALEDILAKQEQIRALFATDYKYLEIKPDPEVSSTPSRWIVRVLSIDFAEGPYTTTCDYTITLEAQTDSNIRSYDETWTLTPQEAPQEDTYILEHRISCSSREEYVVATGLVTAGYEKAQVYVEDNLGGPGIDGAIVNSDPGFDLAVSFNAYKYNIVKTIDEHNGKYDITETWIMSENPTYSEQTVEISFDRDNTENQANVVVAGAVTAFKTLAGGGYSNAVSEFNTQKLTFYSSASAISVPLGFTLQSNPKSYTVTHDEVNRKVSYNYVYSENLGTSITDTSITVSTSDDDCGKITVTVDGTITGISTSGDNGYTNAVTAYEAYDDTIDDLALAAYQDYGGTGTLRGPTNKSVTYKEKQRQIGFSFIYNDWTTDTVHNQRVDVKNTEDDYTSITISGNIKAFCAEGYAAALTEYTNNVAENDVYAIAASYYNGYYTLCEKPYNKSVTHGELDRTIEYSYEFSDRPECNGIVEMSISIKRSSEDCDRQYVTVDGTITGRRTNSGNPWDNAKLLFTSYGSDDNLAAGYVGDLKLRSQTVVYNENAHKINFNYEYAEEDEDYSIETTITEKYSQEECGVTFTTVEGTITGYCTHGEGSAYEHALEGLAAYDPGIVGTRTGYSVTKNERQGKVSFAYEYNNRDDNYTWSETITQEDNFDNGEQIYNVDGEINGVCIGTDENSKYENALVGLDEHTPPTGVPSGYVLIGTSIGKNVFSGRVTYAYKYRKRLNSCFTEAVSESITVTDSEPVSVVATSPVLGGYPVIQDKGSTTIAERTLNIDLTVYNSGAGCTLTTPDNVDVIIANFTPVADKVVKRSDVVSRNPVTGKYTREIKWIYGNCV